MKLVFWGAVALIVANIVSMGLWLVISGKGILVLEEPAPQGAACTYLHRSGTNTVLVNGTNPRTLCPGVQP